MVICIPYALSGGFADCSGAAWCCEHLPSRTRLPNNREVMSLHALSIKVHMLYTHRRLTSNTRPRRRIQRPGKTAGVVADTLLGWVTLAGEFTAPLAVVMGCHSGIWVSFKEQALLEPFRIALRRQAPRYAPHWPWAIKSDSTLAHYDVEIFLLCLRGCVEPSFPYTEDRVWKGQKYDMLLKLWDFREFAF